MIGAYWGYIGFRVRSLACVHGIGCLIVWGHTQASRTGA